MLQSQMNLRPGLAIVANCLTPYRVNLHRLIVRHIPEVQLHTIVSHGAAEFDWRLDQPADINVQCFGGVGHSPLARLHHAPLREWQKAGQIFDYIRQHNVRAVICGLPRYLSYVRLCLLCHKTGIPFFVNSDANIRSDGSIGRAKSTAKQIFHSWWMKRVSGVMTMGDWGDDFFRRYGARSDQLYRIPYTPDYDLFSVVELHRLERFRGAFGLAPNRRYFLFSGRLNPVKRVDLLIDSFVALADERPNWDLLIVGTGPLEEELRARIPDRLRSRIIWIGFLETQDMAAAYHAADVLVLPSDREPWAVVVQEAMAAGLAVVASDVVGAAHELIDDGHSGRIFPHGSTRELYHALKDVSAAEHLSGYKEHARSALAIWRARVNPIAEVRRALVDFHVIDS